MGWIERIVRGAVESLLQEYLQKLVTVPLSRIEARLTAIETEQKVYARELASFRREFDLKLDAFRREVDLKLDGIHQEINGLRREVDLKLDAFRREFDLKLDAFRREVDLKLDGLRRDFDAKFEKMQSDVKLFGVKVDALYNIVQEARANGDIIIVSAEMLKRFKTVREEKEKAILSLLGAETTSLPEKREEILG